MRQLDRRTALTVVGGALVAGTAGCSDGSGPLDVRVENDRAEKITYEITVGTGAAEPFEGSGSLGEGERETYNEVIDSASSGDQFDLEFAFGTEVDGEFTPFQEVDDEVAVGGGSEVVFVRVTDSRIRYGATDDTAE
jgi:hypothetical protein